MLNLAKNHLKKNHLLGTCHRSTQILNNQKIELQQAVNGVFTYEVTSIHMQNVTYLLTRKI